MKKKGRGGGGGCAYQVDHQHAFAQPLLSSLQVCTSRYRQYMWAAQQVSGKRARLRMCAWPPTAMRIKEERLHEAMRDGSAVSYKANVAASWSAPSTQVSKTRSSKHMTTSYTLLEVYVRKTVQMNRNYSLLIYLARQQPSTGFWPAPLHAKRLSDPVDHGYMTTCTSLCLLHNCPLPVG